MNRKLLDNPDVMNAICDWAINQDPPIPPRKLVRHLAEVVSECPADFPPEHYRYLREHHNRATLQSARGRRANLTWHEYMALSEDQRFGGGGPCIAFTRPQTIGNQEHLEDAPRGRQIEAQTLLHLSQQLALPDINSPMWLSYPTNGLIPGRIILATQVHPHKTEQVIYTGRGETPQEAIFALLLRKFNLIPNQATHTINEWLHVLNPPRYKFLAEAIRDIRTQAQLCGPYRFLPPDIRRLAKGAIQARLPKHRRSKAPFNFDYFISTY